LISDYQPAIQHKPAYMLLVHELKKLKVPKIPQVEILIDPFWGKTADRNVKIAISSNGSESLKQCIAI
jgi:hypothetical protein